MKRIMQSTLALMLLVSFTNSAFAETGGAGGSIPCESQAAKYYEMSGHGIAYHTVPKYQEMTEWWNLHDKVKNQCEEELQTEDAANAIDCLSHCTQWECDPEYRSTILECMVWHQIHDYGGSHGEWGYEFRAIGRGWAKCKCTSPNSDA